MTLLWDEDLKMHTVHVDDVSRAILFLFERGDAVGQVCLSNQQNYFFEKPYNYYGKVYFYDEFSSQIYNLVDYGNTTQGVISHLLADIFNIQVDFCGHFKTSFIDIEGAAEEANDTHLVSKYF